MNQRKREEAIKMNLYAYGLQDDNSQDSIQLLHTFQKSHFSPCRQNSFRQVSDWQNRYSANDQQKPYAKSSADMLQQSDVKKRRSFLYVGKSNSKLKQRSQQFPSPQTKKKFELNPIVVRFNLTKSKTLHKKQHSSLHKKDQNLSIYEMNYEPLTILYEMKTKPKDNRPPKISPYEQELVHVHSPKQRYPKTERISSILRALKRNQQIKMYKNNISLNEDDQKWKIFKQ